MFVRRGLRCLLLVGGLLLFFLQTGNAQSDLKVGVIAPLSGGVAPMGEAFRKGFDLFAKEMPAAKVSFLFEDSRYDGKASLSAFHKLSEVDKVDLIVVWGNTPSDTVAPIAEKSRFPVLAISMNPVAKDRAYVVSLGPPRQMLVQQVNQTFDDWELKNAAAVSIDIGSALEGVERVKANRNGELAVTIVSGEDNDFKSIIANLKAKKVDGLLLLMLPEQALTFTKQAYQMKFTPRIIGGDIFADEEFQRKVREYSREISYVYGAVDSSFLPRVKHEFGESSYFFETACGYTVALLTHRVAEQATQWKSNPLEALLKVDSSGVPLGGFQLSDTPEFGRHFEVTGRVYR